ncbi:MAG: hypothetical protein JXA33_09880 [Anaerolineae bacterium]|nr:hypothetical protein [Anaerolineae bacterium]
MGDLRTILRGIKIHRDVNWNYSFVHPTHWYRYDMQDRYGFIYTPEQDPRTGFCITIRDLSDILDGPVTEADMPALHEGLIAGLQQLPDCNILEEKEAKKGYGIGFEVLLTFTLDGETCKRHLRLLYNDRQQFTIYGQGVPETEYDVFHDIFEYMYITFDFGDILAQQGVILPSEIGIYWQGEDENVQTEPRVPRKH